MTVLEEFANLALRFHGMLEANYLDVGDPASLLYPE